MVDYTKIFAFHGLEIDHKSDTQAQTDCISCGKENHLHISKPDGKINCKACTWKGNTYTFLRELHHLATTHTTPDHLEQISQEKSIPISILQTWGVVKNPINDCLILPSYNHKGTIANLYKFDSPKPNSKKIWLATPICKLHPWGLQFLNPPCPEEVPKQKIIYIVEGPWDGMAIYHLLSTHRKKGKSLIKTTNPDRSLLQSRGVLAIPGASTFKAEWYKFVHYRAPIICFDNDHPKEVKTRSGEKRIKQPGWEATLSLSAKLTTSPITGLNVLDWGRYPLPYDEATRSQLEAYSEGLPTGHHPALPSGFDLRDLLTTINNPDNQFYPKTKKPPNPILFLNNLTTKIDISPQEEEPTQPTRTIEPIPCNSFNQLLTYYQADLYFTQPLQDALAVMLASILSTPLPDDQLWIRIIGPPSSGKTTLAEALSAAPEYTYPTSVLTGLHSGYREGFHDKKDHGLIPKIKGKTLIVKDADTLNSQSNYESIMADLRDYYDGVSRSNYRNKAGKNYTNLRGTVILCGTDQLRKTNRPNLGERFLDCDIPPLDETDKILDSAITSMLSKASRQQETPEYARATMGFLDHKFEQLDTWRETKLKPPRQSTLTKIKNLAKMITLLRQKAEKDREEGGIRQRVEAPTRVTKQLTKLSLLLSYILDQPIEKEPLRITTKVARDTIQGHQTDIAQLLITNREEGGYGLTPQQIEIFLNLPLTTVRRYLNTMQLLGIIRSGDRPNNSGIKGRHSHLMTITPEVFKLWRKTFNNK